MSLTGTHSGPEHRLERMIFFSDAVFAIAITLLIIEIRVPVLPEHANDRQWIEAIVALMPHFAAFVLSFLVIGALWGAHHSIFSLVARFDPRLMMPNLQLLLAVAFLPFSTALMAEGLLAPVPYAFYAASLLVAGLLKMRLAYKALAPALIAPGVSAERVRIEQRRQWLMPIAALFSLLLAFAIPGWNNLAMLLLFALRLPMFRPPPEDAPSLH